MSQRNPMNERYTVDDRKGQTRKSAAKAKPKTKAASSVRVQSTTKSPKEKKAAQRQEQQKKQQVDRRYYNPDTPEYKKWRRVWWAALILAIVMTALSFLFRYWLPAEEVLSMVVLGLAYIGLISALVIEFTKVKKIRRAYQAEMQAKHDKESRAEAKKAKAAMHAANKNDDKETEEPPAKTSLLSFLRKPSQATTDDAKEKQDTTTSDKK